MSITEKQVDVAVEAYEAADADPTVHGLDGVMRHTLEAALEVTPRPTRRFAIAFLDGSPVETIEGHDLMLDSDGIAVTVDTASEKGLTVLAVPAHAVRLAREVDKPEPHPTLSHLRYSQIYDEAQLAYDHESQHSHGLDQALRTALTEAGVTVEANESKPGPTEHLDLDDLLTVARNAYNRGLPATIDTASLRGHHAHALYSAVRAVVERLGYPAA